MGANERECARMDVRAGQYNKMIDEKEEDYYAVRGGWKISAMDNKE
jgi:hypothetical protein